MLRHKFLLQSLLLLAAVLPCFGPSLAAQDLTLDLKTGGPRTEGAVTVTYKWYEEGANIDKGGTINNVLDISSTKDIVRIDFEGAVRRAGGVVVLNNNGTLDFQPQGTSKWTGKSSHIVFAAADDNAEYFISGIRIWYEGSTAFLATPTIAYEGGQFTISSTTSGAADPDNMHLVVFISSFDDYTYPEKDGKKDYFNSEVHNADEVALSELPKTTGPDCDTPVISLKKGALQFSSATEGAAIHYTLAPIEGTIAGGNVSCADVAFEVTAVAKADYHAPSLPATATYTLADVQASFTPKENPVVFVNPCDGMEYADGETMIITPEIDAEWGDVMFPAPALRNKSAEDITANLHYSINMPHGSFSECISGKCYSRDANGDYTSGNFIIPAGKDIPSLCEWSCGYTDTWEPKTGTCITNFTLYVEGEEGPTVTVKYVYDTRPVMVNTIGSAGYSTLYADRALSIPDGLKAYTATEDNGSLKTAAITDGVIPARTGVILEGSAKPYVFYAAPNYGKADRGCLKGVLTETPNPGGTYVLSIVNGCLGFYKYAENAKLKANRAYYQPSVAGVSAFLLDFDETLTTGIDELSDVKYQKNNTYDLTGRAVNSATNAQRGIVIAGSKKIIQ